MVFIPRFCVPVPVCNLVQSEGDRGEVLLEAQDGVELGREPCLAKGEQRLFPANLPLSLLICFIEGWGYLDGLSFISAMVSSKMRVRRGEDPKNEIMPEISVQLTGYL